MMKILIAVDGSEHANRAIDAIAKMARSSPDLQAILICVRTGAILEPLFAGDYSEARSKMLDAEQETEQTHVLNNALAYAHEKGLMAAEPLRSYGPIAHEILRIAKDREVDLIAMGTRGMGAVASMFIGSVAQRVLHQSEVPVLLVK